MPRTHPSRAFLVRDRHRNLLAVHFFGMLSGVALVFLANRFILHGAIWAHWVALAWAGLFAAHFVWFSRATLATMGGKGGGAEGGARHRLAVFLEDEEGGEEPAPDAAPLAARAPEAPPSTPLPHP
jgi:hypothetical protein